MAQHPNDYSEEDLSSSDTSVCLRCSDFEDCCCGENFSASVFPDLLDHRQAVISENFSTSRHVVSTPDHHMDEDQDDEDVLYVDRESIIYIDGVQDGDESTQPFEPITASTPSIIVCQDGSCIDHPLQPTTVAGAAATTTSVLFSRPPGPPLPHLCEDGLCDTHTTNQSPILAAEDQVPIFPARPTRNNGTIHDNQLLYLHKYDLKCYTIVCPHSID